MGCCGGGRHDDDDLINVKAEQKWDYINLTDFKTSSCFTGFSYFILYTTIITSFAVYGVDTFTAINLLAFSRWASQIKPKIPFHISKWIFAGCIIFSFVLLAYRWFRAVRVIRSGGVAQSYLDPIAVRIQSTRMGSEGQGYRRFLVFAELTKSKKGADYVALFTYFNFEAWLRVLVAEGPRQVINGITLYSVMQLSLIPIGENAPPDGRSPVAQFFKNIEALAEKDKLQATILFAMLFTFVIWVLSMISLAISAIFYIFFLWHHIPSEDGSLKAYCRRTIDKRLERIVKRKVNKALAKGLALQDRSRTDLETGIDNVKRQPTLPSLDYASTVSASEMPPMPGLSRQTTMTTLPPYSRTDTSASSFGIDRKPSMPDTWESRNPGMVGPGSTTRTSDDSASLLGNAGAPGYSEPPQPLTLPDRYGTPLSASSDFRPFMDQSRRTPAPSPVDSYGRRTPGINTAAPQDVYNPARPPLSASSVPDRSMTAPIPNTSPSTYRNFTRPWAGPSQMQAPRQQAPPQYPDSFSPPRRVGTAPTYQNQQPYNQNYRY